ncbi:MAG: DUF2254 domain-containing protein [Actinomycetaceae bacterium]|nr:DUF2254 domain-containing protein [Actinomycetaceae bacterium]
MILGKIRQLASDKVWLVPLLASLLAAIAAVALSAVRIDREHWISSYLWPGDTAAAADMLSFIASSMLTALTTVISMTLIVLQVAAGQFSRQLLRDYIRSKAVKGIFSVFTAVFVYALVLLRSVEAEGIDEPPQLAMTLAMILVLVSLGTFVWYVARVVDMVRVDSIIEAVSTRVEELYKRHRNAWEETAQAPEVPDHARPIRAGDSGFVREVFTKYAARWAKNHDAVVVATVAPGDPVVTGQVVAWVFGRDQSLEEEVELPKDMVGIDPERTAEADIRLGVRQLSDIAVRAMSPGVNDPTTAVHAVNQAISLLRMAAEDPLANEVVKAEDDGRVLAFAPSPKAIDFIHEIVGPVRRYSGAEPAVLIQLLRLLAVVEEGAQESEVAQVIAKERRRIVETARNQMPHPDDAQWVESLASADAVREASRVRGPHADLVESDEDGD